MVQQSEIDSNQSIKPYRPNVGMVIFNQSGQVLAGERIQFPGAWQFPQGGIDPGEEPQLAAVRELFEEVGIKNPELISEYPEWIEYNFPSELGIIGDLKNFKGQTQKWFLFYWNNPIEICNLEVHEREFTSIRFMPFLDILDKIVDFKKPTYKRLYEFFQPIINDFIKYRNNR